MKEIPLTQGKVALVDDADYEWLGKMKWYAFRNGKGRIYYAARKKLGRVVFMHRDIMGVAGKIEIDHRDSNGLNNQRHNLRVCTHSENMKNIKKYKPSTSGYKGVNFDKKVGRFRARIRVNLKLISLGYFDDPAEAARVYDKAARQYFGEFANTNF
jgi:hypothetical protein